VRFPNVEIHRIWKALDPIKTDDGMMILLDTTFVNCPPLDVICVGGGLEIEAVVDGSRSVLNFPEPAQQKFITSVCGGLSF